MAKARTLNPYDMEERINRLEENGGVSADEAKRSDIATEFSATTSYTAGNFVYYQGKLYIFNVDHAAGAWDASDVSPANVTDEVTSNKAAIDTLAAVTAMGHHAASGADTIVKKVTLANPFQQLLVTLLDSGTRSVYLVSQYGTNPTVAENIFTTPDHSPIAINATRVDNSNLTLSVPRYTNLNIMSTEAFTVSDYTP